MGSNERRHDGNGADDAGKKNGPIANQSHVEIIINLVSCSLCNAEVGEHCRKKDNSRLRHVHSARETDWKWLQMQKVLAERREDGELPTRKTLAKKKEQKVKLRLNAVKVHKILDLLAEGLEMQEIAERMGCSKNTVWDLSRGRTWKAEVLPRLEEVRRARSQSKVGKLVRERGRLRAEDIPLIRRLLREGRSCRQIGDIFGVARATIDDVKAGRSWTSVPDVPDEDNYIGVNRVLTAEFAAAVREKVEAGFLQRDVALMFSISQSTVSRIMAEQDDGELRH